MTIRIGVLLSGTGRTLLNLLCRFAGELLYTIISDSVKPRRPEARAQAL